MKFNKIYQSYINTWGGSHIHRNKEYENFILFTLFYGFNPIPNSQVFVIYLGAKHRDFALVDIYISIN